MPSQPHPPCEKCRLAASAHPRQSEDCLRVRVHRHAPLLARRGRLAAAAFPAQHIRSVLSIMRRCVGALGCRARIRRKARNPSASGFARWGLIQRRCVSGSPPCEAARSVRLSASGRHVIAFGDQRPHAPKCRRLSGRPSQRTAAPLAPLALVRLADALRVPKAHGRATEGTQREGRNPLRPKPVADRSQ